MVAVGEKMEGWDLEGQSHILRVLRCQDGESCTITVAMPVLFQGAVITVLALCLTANDSVWHADSPNHHSIRMS